MIFQTLVFVLHALPAVTRSNPKCSLEITSGPARRFFLLDGPAVGVSWTEAQQYCKTHWGSQGGILARPMNFTENSWLLLQWQRNCALKVIESAIATLSTTLGKLAELFRGNALSSCKTFHPP